MFCCIRHFEWRLRAFERPVRFERCIHKASDNKPAQFEFACPQLTFPDLCTIDIQGSRIAFSEGILCRHDARNCEIREDRYTGGGKPDMTELGEVLAADGKVDPKQLGCHFQEKAYICKLRHIAL